MLEKPDLPDVKISACLQNEYGLQAAEIAFLPLGADRNTAVYRAVTHDSTPYFVKLRSGPFDETTVIVPRLLADQGSTQVIAPLRTQSQQLWATVESFKLTVSPFVAGRNGYEMNLSDQQWVALGQVLKSLHTAAIPTAVTDRIPRETCTAHWRDAVRSFMRMIQDTHHFADPVSAALAALLKAQQPIIYTLVQRAEQLAAVLQQQTHPFVLCHADMHAGNALINATGHLYVVDWDTLIMAPKERDLMFPGGGLFGGWRAPEDEEHFFYQGYGDTAVDLVALAYYRYERIVQDIAAYCEQILLTDAGGEDRAEGLRQLQSQFQTGAVIEIAFRSEQKLRNAYRAG